MTYDYQVALVELGRVIGSDMSRAEADKRAWEIARDTGYDAQVWRNGEPAGKAKFAVVEPNGFFDPLYNEEYLHV
jgi:hypothetical protein